MPLPIIFGAGAAVSSLLGGLGIAGATAALTTVPAAAVVAGVTASASGAQKIKASTEQIKEAKERHNKNIDSLQKAQEQTEQTINSYEKEVAKIRSSFEHFSDLIEELQNRPQFKPYKSGKITLPELSLSKMKQDNITPLAIGVGILFGATSPLGGLITVFVGHSLSEKADEIWDEMRQCEKQITIINQYLAELRKCIQEYKRVLAKVTSLYYPRLYALENILHNDNRKDWYLFTEEEQLMVENLVLLVSLLYEMIKVDFLSEEDENGLREINKFDSEVMTEVATDFMQNTHLDLNTVVPTPSQSKPSTTVNGVATDYASVVFSIQGTYSDESGATVVYGAVTDGVIQTGSTLYLHNKSNNFKTVEVVGFDQYPATVARPTNGTPVALVLKGISCGLISVGDRITNSQKNI